MCKKLQFSCEVIKLWLYEGTRYEIENISLINLLRNARSLLRSKASFYAYYKNNEI